MSVIPLTLIMWRIRQGLSLRSLGFLLLALLVLQLS